MRASQLSAAGVIATSFALCALGCASDEAPTEGGGGPDLPEDLFATGLYAEGHPGALGPGVRPYKPAQEFWSDGAEKSRWLYLPPGTTIDASDPEGWVFPVGTKAWKELRLDGKPIETRVLWKVEGGPRGTYWLAAAYRWMSDGSQTFKLHSGEENVNGTGYEIPGPLDCNECHGGARDQLLGLEPISLGLDGASGITLEVLANEGLLSPPPPATKLTLTRAADDGSPAAAEATARAVDAARWLHTNCGVSCHNRREGAAYHSGFYARLAPTASGLVAVDESDIYTTTIGRAAIARGFQDFERVSAGRPDRSLVYLFATTRDDPIMRPMPPLVTHRVDPAGKAALEQWIGGL